MRGVGIDIIEIDRVRSVLQRHGARFTGRVFLDSERRYCASRRDPARHYAARFAAKEAVVKALAVRRAMAKNPKLEKDGDAVLRGIEDMIADPKLARGGRVAARGSFQRVLDRLHTETAVEPLRRTFADFLGGSMTGIAVIHRASAEPGYLGARTRTEFPSIAKLIRGRLPK